MKNSSAIWETATVVTAADVLDSGNDEYHTGLAKPVVCASLRSRRRRRAGYLMLAAAAPTNGGGDRRHHWNVHPL